MQFNNDPEWLRRQAALEDGCDVSVGLPRVLKLPIDPEAPHEVTCERCRQAYTSTSPNWAETGYCDACTAIITKEMQDFVDTETAELLLCTYCGIHKKDMTPDELAICPAADAVGHRFEVDAFNPETA